MLKWNWGCKMFRDQYLWKEGVGGRTGQREKSNGDASVTKPWPPHGKVWSECCLAECPTGGWQVQAFIHFFLSITGSRLPWQEHDLVTWCGSQPWSGWPLGSEHSLRSWAAGPSLNGDQEGVFFVSTTLGGKPTTQWHIPNCWLFRTLNSKRISTC